MTDMEIIDAIERVRSTNNVSWMDLMRLAFAVAPERARKIVAGIDANDAELNRLSRLLAMDPASREDR